VLPDISVKLADIQQTFDMSVLRSVGAPISPDQEKKLPEKGVKTLVARYDKMFKNSLYGKLKQMPDELVFSAELRHIPDAGYPFWVKFRCSGFSYMMYASEAHACKKHVQDVVKPWVGKNCSSSWEHRNIALIEFKDETDAMLCLMRFK
jgi:hypothetical protein